MNPRKLLPIAIVTLVVTAGGGCASQDTSSTDRSTRASSAVDACRGHRGVSAFDDDIVICRDQTFHRAEGG